LIIVSLIPFIPLFHHPIWAFKLPGEHTHESSAGTHDAGQANDNTAGMDETSEAEEWE